jgi:hypothetical protein
LSPPDHTRAAAGLSFSNKLILRDEGMHSNFVYVLYNFLCIKLNESCVHDIVVDAIETGEDPPSVSSPSLMPRADFPQLTRPTPVGLLLHTTDEECRHASICPSKEPRRRKNTEEYACPTPLPSF